MKVEFILRVLGVLVGILSIIFAVGMLTYDFNNTGVLSKLSMLSTGIVFLLYGALGKNRLAKFLPGANKNIGD